MSKPLLKPLSDDLSSQWDRWVDESENSTLYHYNDWLHAMAAHSATQLIPLVIFRGSSVAGVFPVFLKKTAFLKFIFSPPPGCAVPYLGPVFLSQNMKTKDLESFKLDVISAFNDFYRSHKIDFARIITVPGLTDTRPFIWNGFTARTLYEYRINIPEEENDLILSFQSETRTKIRRALKYEDLEIVHSSNKSWKEVFRLTNERYHEQGINWLVSSSYVEQLINSQIAGHFQSWAAQLKGKTITGMLSFCYKDTFHEWIGGINPTERISGVNELLHWKMMQSAMSNHCKRYDLGGANTPHLSKPKSKYSPVANLYFEFKKRNLKSRLLEPLFKIDWAKKYYKKIRSEKNKNKNV